MGNFSSFETRKHRASLVSSSSFARPTRAFEPVSFPRPFSRDAEAEKRPHLGWNFADIPVFSDSAKKNTTGLPDRLKAGIESLSGLSMDDVQVHYHSSKPAEVQAHAYAQGTHIYVGPEADEDLPEEAWHVVQQKQGQVQPTIQAGSVAINDDQSLEKEAEMMGAKALQLPLHSAATFHQPSAEKKMATPSGSVGRKPAAPTTPLRFSGNVLQLQKIRLLDAESDDEKEINVSTLPIEEIASLFAKLHKKQRWSDILRVQQEIIDVPRNFATLAADFHPEYEDALRDAMEKVGENYSKVKADKRGHALGMHLPSDKAVKASEINESLGEEDLAGAEDVSRKKARIKLRVLYGMSPRTGEKGNYAESSGGFLNKNSTALLFSYITERLIKAAAKSASKERNESLPSLFPRAAIKVSSGSASVTQEMRQSQRYVILIPFKEVFGSTPVESIWYSVTRRALPRQVKSSSVSDIQRALSEQTTETTPHDADETWILAIADIGVDDYVLTTSYLVDKKGYDAEVESGRDTKRLA